MADIDHQFARRFLAWRQFTESNKRDGRQFDVAAYEPAIPAEYVGTDQMLRAQEAWATALSLWPDEDDAFEFLTRKHAMLDDERPVMAAVASVQGLDSVKQIIGRLRYGSAA